MGEKVVSGKVIETICYNDLRNELGRDPSPNSTIATIVKVNGKPESVNATFVRAGEKEVVIKVEKYTEYPLSYGRGEEIFVAPTDKNFPA